MTQNKVRQVFEMYRNYLVQGDPVAKPERMDVFALESWDFYTDRHFSHLLYMCEQGVGFVNAGRMDKAFRWLGFLQGVLVSLGIFTLDEVGKHNMPDPLSEMEEAYQATQ